MSYQIYKAKLRNEPIPSQSTYIIFQEKIVSSFTFLKFKSSCDCKFLHLQKSFISHTPKLVFLLQFLAKVIVIPITAMIGYNNSVGVSYLRKKNHIVEKDLK